MNHRLTGLVAAPHSPLHPDGTLNLDMVEKQVEHLVRNSITGAFVCGTTGEYSSLTLDERRALAERWVAVVRGTPLKVIVHVGYGFMGAAKATMKLLGVDVGPARLPLSTLTPEETARLRSQLEELGFFEWIAQA